MAKEKQSLDDNFLQNRAYAAPAPPRRAYDRRRIDRRYLQIPVRFMTEGEAEHAGVLRDISAIGLGIEADVGPALHSQIVVYIDRIGRFEGRVVRAEATGFGVKMDLTDQKRIRFEQAVKAYIDANDPDADVSDRRDGVADRREKLRHVVDLHEITGVAADDETFTCTILNLSLSGVEIATDADLVLGDPVTIGVVKGVIVRKTARGFAIKRRDVE
ncbi:MAG: PilZ domain-containing protein [Pseudomonadota bacterium]